MLWEEVKIRPFSSVLGLISGNFGLFLAQNEISGVFGQSFAPDGFKISVGILNQVSGGLRNFGQYGNTDQVANREFVNKKEIRNFITILGAKPLQVQETVLHVDVSGIM